MICQKCVIDLQGAVSVRSKCLEADEYFRSIIPKETFSIPTFDNEESIEDHFNRAIKVEPLDEVENVDLPKPEIEESNQLADVPPIELALLPSDSRGKKSKDTTRKPRVRT